MSPTGVENRSYAFATRRDGGTVATVPLAGLETFPLRGARRATLRSLQLLFPRPAVGKCEVLAGLWPGTPGSAYRAVAARRSIRHSAGCVDPLPMLLTLGAERRRRPGLLGEVGSPRRGPRAGTRACASCIVGLVVYKATRLNFQRKPPRSPPGLAGPRPATWAPCTVGLRPRGPSCGVR